MIAAPEAIPDRRLVSATTTTYNWLVVQNYAVMTPDFAQVPFTLALGQARKEEIQWRWENPFMEAKPVGG